MAVSENSAEDQLKNRALTNDCLLHFLEHSLGVGANLADLHYHSISPSLRFRNRIWSAFASAGLGETVDRTNL